MKTLSRITLLILMIALLALPSLIQTTSYAQDDAVCDAIVFMGAWSRPAVALDGEGNGVGYGILANLGEADETLINVSSDAANVIELHEVAIDDNDVMQMRPLDGGIPIPAGGFAELRPGGYHIMMIGLTKDLLPDEEVTLTLEFENAEPITITYPVLIDTPTSEQVLVAATGNLENCAEVALVGATARPVNEGENDTSVYGLLVNLSDEDVALTAASTEVADDVPHFGDSTPDMDMDDMSESDDMEDDMSDDGGMDDMDMTNIDEIVIPANGFTMLSAEGPHIGVTGLNTDLAAGDSFDLTLTFSDGTEQVVSATIVMPAMSEMDMDMDHDMDDMDDMEDDMDMENDADSDMEMESE